MTASPTDNFVDVLMTMQGTFNSNDLPDRLINYMIIYHLTDPSISDRERQIGLYHIMRGLGLAPGQEEYNVFDRVTRPDMLLDLAEMGFDPYQLTIDGYRLHQTRLNLNQWAALLEMGYNLAAPGGSDIPSLPTFGTNPSHLTFDPNRALFGLIATIAMLPPNYKGVTPEELNNLIRLIHQRIREMSDLPNLMAYLNYVAKLRHPSPVAIQLINAIQQGLRDRLKTQTSTASRPKSVRR
jgi:hypothetical protein